MVHPDDRATTEQLFAACYRTGEALVHQHRLWSKDGGYRWFLIRHIPWHDKEGRIVRWFGAATDIHELHDLQERQSLLVAGSSIARATSSASCVRSPIRR